MTVQIKDTLIYKGESFGIHSNVMEPFFHKYPEKRPKKVFFSALWKGYVCETEIDQGKLYIRSLSAPSTKPNGRGFYDFLNRVFPNANDYFLHWYSGIIVIGTAPNPDHPKSFRGYPIYEVNQLLEIKNGIHTQTRIFNYDELQVFEKEQFLLYKKTKAYAQLKQTEIERIEAHNTAKKNSKEKLSQFALRTFKEAKFENTIQLQILRHLDRFY